MALELRQLRHVLMLAEHGSFVRAAVALHMSQPALSRSIQNLEKQVGTVLFVRASDGVVPTDLGRLYVERARDVLRMADEFDRDAVSYRSLQSGRVTVGGGPYPAESVLGRAAAKFVEQFPRVNIQLRVRNWDELLRELRSRKLDFFVAEISTLQQEQGIEISPMSSTHPLFFVARWAHPLARRGDVTAADTFAWPFVAPSRIPPRLLGPMLASQRTAPSPPSAPRAFPSIECNSVATVKRIVEGSDAITAVTLSCITAELESQRYALLGTAPWLHLRYGVVSLKGRPMTHAAEKFREFVVDAESAASLEEQRLVARWYSRGSRRRRRPAKTASRER